MGAEKYKIMRGAALTGGARHMAIAWKRPLREGGELSWERAEVKRPGKSVGMSFERQAWVEDGLSRKVKPSR